MQLTLEYEIPYVDLKGGCTKFASSWRKLSAWQAGIMSVIMASNSGKFHGGNKYHSVHRNINANAAHANFPVLLIHLLINKLQSPN